jgi:NAD(P)-dependent dehydrogenase (short-subunit alcohol dehydrogenase family)
MDLQLDGKVALVTGGTKGIGRACVEALAAEGATVAFCARTASEVETAAKELTAAGHTVVGTALDVADKAALEGWVGTSAEQLGRIDVVVANVSAISPGTTEENWSASFQVDLMHTVRLCAAAMPHLTATKGSIVAISSVSGREIDLVKDAYGTMKAALIHYIQGLAFEHAAAGVRANTVSPGNTYFPGGFWAGVESGNPELFAQSLSLNPTGRMAQPQEIAYAVTMLASPRASFITGTNVVVDGALTRGVQL